uniref:Uncharacterized protein n=1 Tax=Tetranychus urticae TaxID=32264 RepID=T1KV32_TETUR
MTIGITGNNGFYFLLIAGKDVSGQTTVTPITQ